jgi:hypothetical protein
MGDKRARAWDREWAEDQETQEFLDELRRRQGEYLKRLLVQCRQAPDLLEIRKIIGAYDEVGKIIDSIDKVANENPERQQKA